MKIGEKDREALLNFERRKLKKPPTWKRHGGIIPQHPKATRRFRIHIVPSDFYAKLWPHGCNLFRHFTLCQARCKI